MVYPNGDHVFFSFLDYNNLLIITHCCSNESISNIDFRTLVNSCDLAHCAAWKVLTSIWKHRYSFQGGCSVDEHGELLWRLYNQKGITAIILPRCLKWTWIIIIFDICITMVGGALIEPIWCYIMCTHRGIRSTLEFNLYRSIRILQYDKRSVMEIDRAISTGHICRNGQFFCLWRFRTKILWKNINYEI